MVLKIEIQNINQVEKFLRELPKKIDESFTRGNQLWMESLRDKAKRRAPVDTGLLRESIKLTPIRKGKNVKQWKLVVTSPYALFQEEGFTPHRFFAGVGFNSSRLTPGRSYFVSKWTPFIEPALEDNLTKFDAMINKSLRKALK